MATTPYIPPVLPHGLTFGLTLGAIEVGVLISSVLWGCTCVQTYIYASSPKQDRLTPKLLVALVVFLETVHMVLIWAYFYDMTVTQYGNTVAISGIPWTFNVALGLHAWISGFVQAFFSYRIWKVSGKIWLAIPAWFVAFARIAVTMSAVAILSMGEKGYKQFTEKDGFIVDTALSLSMAVDVWNTTALSYYLWTAKTSVFKRTSDLMQTIMRLTMETGLAIVVVAMVELAVWIYKPESGMWIGALLVYARMYSNSLLVSLNARELRSNNTKSHATTSGSRSQNLSGGIVLTRTQDVEMTGIGFNEPEDITVTDDKIDGPFGDYK